MGIWKKENKEIKFIYQEEGILLSLKKLVSKIVNNEANVLADSDQKVIKLELDRIRELAVSNKAILEKSFLTLKNDLDILDSMLINAGLFHGRTATTLKQIEQETDYNKDKGTIIINALKKYENELEVFEETLKQLKL